ncbi:MAG: ABC transporter ATP-binding protein [Myxococcota bacterium]
MEGLILKDVSVWHRGRGLSDVVHDVSFSCPRGKATALIGPNGAGKSSLLKAVIGLLPSRGEIRLDGRSLKDLPAQERAREVAYVPQRSRLDARLQVRDVVDQGRFVHRGPLARPSAGDRDAVEQALEEVDAVQLAGRIFTELSGGEQQKILIARALATGARALLLDEPTAALDARHVLVLHRLLRKLAERGWCIVVVVHGLDEAHRHADQAVLISEGRLHAAGPVQSIVSADPVRTVYGVVLKERAGIGLFLPEETRS